MKYFAHRGASLRLPANSLPAFALARQLGAVDYELDVHMTRDGMLVVHHDYTLLGTTGHNITLGSLAYEELKKYPLINPKDPRIVSYIPAFKEVLPIIEEEMQLLNIEIKNDDNIYPGIEKHILETFQKNSPELFPKVLFSSFDYPTLQRLRALSKKIRLGYLTRNFDLEKAEAVNASSVHINHTRVTKEMVETCHAHKMKVYVYTVNDGFLGKQLERIGVDGIFTDRLDLFIKSKASLTK